MHEGTPMTASAIHLVRKYLAVFRRWFWLLGMCTLLGGLGAFTASKLVRPTYRATALLVVGQQTTGSDAYTGVLASTQMIPTYLSLIDQPVVLQHAAAQVGGISAQQLAANTSIKDQAGTQIIELDVDDASAVRAARLSNAIAASFIDMQQRDTTEALAREQQHVDEQLATLAKTIRALNAQMDALRAEDPNSPHLQELEQQVSVDLAHQSALQTVSNQIATQAITQTSAIKVFQEATPPQAPATPKPMLNAAIGGVLGLVIAGVVVWVLELFDRRIRTVDQAKALLGLPVLGAICTYPGLPVLGPPSNRKLAASIHALVASLQLRLPDQPMRTIAVTSATSGEGKTTTAVNLAIALAGEGRRVLLVDTDLHEPFDDTLSEGKHPPFARRASPHVDIQDLLVSLTGRPSTISLSNVVMPPVQKAIDFPAVPGIPGLHVLPAGHKLPGASVLLQSSRMRHFLQWQLDDPSGGRFDAIVLDTPPVDTYSDAALLARWVDATILVVDAARSHEDAVLRARDMMQQAHATITGIVLNRAPSRERHLRVPGSQGSMLTDWPRDVDKYRDERVDDTDPLGASVRRGGENEAAERTITRGPAPTNVAKD